MSVVSVTPYPIDIKDRKEKFHGAQLLYVGWDKHLLFFAPAQFCLPPDTRFRDLCEVHLPVAFSEHPDFASINWEEAKWLKSGQPFEPDLEKTLAANGLDHKDVLRLQTPGLEGLGGVGI
ncbi:phenol hydroxylase subunit P4 [Telluria mixta]|uniref:Phenol hydroxylase subunit P4 n=1 Tax=Telluria mixta TaxID=34071 RepID=A0ABT2C1J0_9BURK|nr:phenol hydroxylase subunit P4 [Telluria mixta]MCS0631248.1 phenol hydroxylase subunit P4 [Telluria mixta]WEM95786.1 phenol hydroxylase subunit P4 [Telluria mixta]